MTANENHWLAEQFETHRTHLRAVAFRMLGSSSEADDAVQEAWFRLNRTDSAAVANLGGWLTTVVARICLDMLRSRKSRREESLDTVTPEISPESTGDDDPEREVLMVDSLSFALLVVLESLSPAERVAFVLHDVFAVPYDEIAPIVDRSSTTTRQLASRARRRVQGSDMPPGDRAADREVVEAFLKAARSGDLSQLLGVLDPDVVVSADSQAERIGAANGMRGAEDVAKSVLTRAGGAQLALVDGVVGAVWAPHGRPRVVLTFEIEQDKIVAINVQADRDYLGSLDLYILDA